MRVSRDAREYADAMVRDDIATTQPANVYRDAIAEAFQAGIEHERARRSSLDRFKPGGKAPVGPDA